MRNWFKRTEQPIVEAPAPVVESDPAVLATEDGGVIRQSQLVALVNDCDEKWDEARQIIRESFDHTGMRALAEEEVGWRRLDLVGSSILDPLGDSARRDKVQQSRKQGLVDPLSVHALRLYRVFTIGRGIDIQVDEKQDNADAIKKQVDAFWKAPQNRSVFGYLGLLENTDRWNKDGELIFAIFPGAASKPTKVRRVEPLQITKIVYGKEDTGTVQGYLREFTGKNNEQEKWFYWDALLPAEDREDGEGESVIPEGFKERDETLYFAPYGRRGVPLLSPSLAWGKAHKEFMGARTAIQQALARFAWTNKVKGGAAAVSAAITQDASGLQTGSRENNPAPTPGSVRVENENSTTTPIKAETGAAAAQVDGAMLILMFGAGVGIMPHWFGAGSEAKFSTSTQMELPMLKTMQEAREIQTSIYLDLIGIDLANAEMMDAVLEVAFRDSITIKDVAEIIEAISKAITADPRFLASKEVSKFILSTLGIAEADEVVEEMFNAPAPDAPPATAANRAESIGRVAEGLRRITEGIEGGE